MVAVPLIACPADVAAKPLDIHVLLDSPDERWPSMDLVGEMLLAEWGRLPADVHATRIACAIPRVARRLPWGTPSKRAFNVDRALTRYLGYPLRTIREHRPRRLFHIVDHSYAHVIHALPAGRTGVYCHDIDAFRPVLDGAAGSEPSVQEGGAAGAALRRALAYVLVTALRRAAVVFHSTHEVRRALVDHGLSSPSRLVHAPYGVAPEFGAEPHRAIDAQMASLTRGQPYLLHVGSEIPRKRLDVLFEVFGRVRARRKGLLLVQQGASLSPAQRDHVARLGIADALVQPPRLPRADLAALYRGAQAVLLTSDAEGFGLPIAEALACGAVVIASDIPVLREVGANAAVYAPRGDVEAWAALVEAVLAGVVPVPPRSVRVDRARTFTWKEHARTILDAYKDLSHARVR